MAVTDFIIIHLITMSKYLFWLCLFFCGSKAFAHPMPSSVVQLSMLDNFIKGEAKIPLVELGNAVGNERVNNLNNQFFEVYFTDHIKATTGVNKWNTQIENIHVDTDSDAICTYKEVVVQFKLTPSDVRYLRTFSFWYDAVIHQVITHSALVYVGKDWNNGIQDGNTSRQVGIVKLDIATEKIYPLQINLEQGSWWIGCKSMFYLGMQHIKEGTDHLLFLIVLLLPAMLLTNGKQWKGFGGTRYSITRLLKIVTAFTIGHSITLLVGAMGWVKLPGKPVEIIIAISILVSAIHALRPIFPGKEAFIAASFGLIHGLAFATVLSNLELSTGKLALSVLCFNVGIEVMQLLVIIMIVPWLILLSKTAVYKWVRITGAMLAAFAALGWIAERSTGTSNFISNSIEMITQYQLWCIAALGVASIIIYIEFIVKNNKLALS